MARPDISPLFDLLQFSGFQLRQATHLTEKEHSRWQYLGHCMPGRAANGGRAYSFRHVVRTTFLRQLVRNVGMPVGDAAMAADVAIQVLEGLLPTDDAGNKLLMPDSDWYSIALALARGDDGEWSVGLVDPDKPSYSDGPYVKAHIILPIQQVASFAVSAILNPLEVAA